MRQFIFLAFIGMLLVKNATPSKNQGYPSRLEWLFGLNNKQDKNKEENKPTVCQSEECKKIARIITESMDKSVDPCDDFYEYACGKWPDHNPIPNGMKSWSMFKRAQINVKRQIKEIFDEGPKKSDLLPVKLAKKWYAVCMNTDAIEEYGLEPLVFTLSRIGGWPLIMEPDEWNEQEYSWQKVDDQYVRLIGRNAFHDVRMRIKYDSNETQKVVHIDTPHLPPGSNYLWNEIDSEEEEDESDEDPSDEEKQSDEQKDSQEPGSEEKDDDKDGNNSNDDNEDDNNDDDEDDNNNDDRDDDNNDEENIDNDTSKEQNDDNNAKKQVGMKKTGKLGKSKKLGHSKKMKSGTHSKKHENHTTKKERIKRRAIPTNVRDKLRVWKNERNHVKQERMKRLKKTLEATTPQISTKETIDENNHLKRYAHYISKVARAIAIARGVEVSEQHMVKDIQDMIKFQAKLAEISVGYSDDEEMTLNDFQEWYDKKKPKTPNSAIDWLYKIGELFDEAHVPIIGGDLNVEIGNLDYFEGLVALLDKTSSRTIVNYIHWNFLSRIIKTTTSEMRKLYYAWEGKEENDDEEVLGVSMRSRKCTEEVVEMSVILAYEYVRNHFSDEITTTASDMIDDIQKEVEYQIKESNWMDDDTKDFVLAKLVNMDKFIGYPDWYKNNTIVKRFFQGLVIGKSYYENILSYDRYSKWKSLRELVLEDEDDDDVMMSPTTVNAYFSPNDNSIALSAADFQSPLFAYGRPQVINYGIIGAIMGHEVNHGFDNHGHLYDKNGNVVEWLSAMAEAYGKRAECFVEQYNNYPIDKASNYKIKNYGNQTVGENIADTMGLEATFRAYQRRQRECGKPDTVLPGLEDFTSDQLFFLSFANLLCEAAKMNTTINKARYDTHSPGRLRLIGSISNSQDFAEAYNCPVGSAMNPEKKCHIWK